MRYDLLNSLELDTGEPRGVFVNARLVDDKLHCGFVGIAPSSNHEVMTLVDEQGHHVCKVHIPESVRGLAHSAYATDIYMEIQNEQPAD